MLALLVLAQLTTVGVHQRTVLPSTTDPTIGQCMNSDECPDRGHDVYTFTGVSFDHWLIPPKLLVILRAHCSDPGPSCHQVYDIDYEAIVRRALAQSYRGVIVLDYPNGNPEGFACANSPYSSCTGSLRDEISFGTASSDKSTISTHPQDAIVPRLRSLLAYLKATYPAEGWDRWMPSSSIKWADVTLAGHSGYAPYIATKKDVNRVVMFAEPADDDAAWVSSLASSTVTPIDRYWGFVHTQDQITQQLYQRVIANWATMGVPAAQRLTTSSPCGAGCLPHIKIVEDEADYSDEWSQLLGWGD